MGELLRAADSRSRAILLTVDHTRAEAMARTMPALLEEASAALGVLSSVTVDRSRTPAVTQRLASTAAGIRATQRWSGWPPAESDDPELSDLVHTLSRARELVARYAPEMVLAHRAQLDDLAAAQARVLHVAWVSTHAGIVALRDFAARAQAQLCRKGDHVPGDPMESTAGRQLRQARGDISRLERIEQLLGAVVGRGYSNTTALEVQQMPRTLERLELALARWDIEVHRALTLTPNPAATVMIGRVNASTVMAVTALLHASEQTARITSGQFAPAAASLDTAHTAWNTAATHWKALTTPEHQPGRALVAAGEELLSSLRQITHDHAGWAEPHLMASRVDLTVAAERLGVALATHVDHAELIRDLSRAPLTSRARTLVRSLEALGVAGDLEQGHSHIGEIPTEDVVRNRPWPLPDAVRQALARTGTRTVDASAAAVRDVGRLTLTETGSYTTRAQGARDQSRPEPAATRTPGLVRDLMARRAATGPAPPMRRA